MSKYFLKSKQPTTEPTNQNSKFFSKPTASQNDCYDSPYKESLSEIKSFGPRNDDDDFKTPKPVKRAPAKAQTKTVQKRRSTRVRTVPKKRTNPIFKTTKDNFANSDINPDHLQMALALSKSAFEAENPAEAGKAEEEHLPNVTGNMKPSVLERYGFRSNKRVRSEQLPKRPKTSRNKYVTPILYTRTEEDRQSLIASKTSLILTRNARRPQHSIKNAESDDCPRSELLKQYVPTGGSVLERGKFTLERGGYYCEALGLDRVEYKVGCLLRNWEEIAGRDRSPTRETAQETSLYVDLAPPETTTKTHLTNTSPSVHRYDEKQENQQLAQETSTSEGISTTDNSNSSQKVKPLTVINNLRPDVSTSRDCISPDLFESDEEVEITEVKQDVMSQSLLDLTPKKNRRATRTGKSTCPGFINDNGIESFESYTKNYLLPTNLSEEIYDLTQSSEDEDTEEVYLRSLENSEWNSNKNKTVENGSTEVADDCPEVSKKIKSSPLSNNFTPVIDLVEDSGHSEEAYIENANISSANIDDCNEANSTVLLRRNNAANGIFSHERYEKVDSSDGNVHGKEGNTLAEDIVCVIEDADSEPEFTEMSPLEFKHSSSFTVKRGKQPEDDLKIINRSGRYSASFRMKSPNFDDSRSEALNVTDYVNEILNSQDSMNGSHTDKFMTKNKGSGNASILLEENKIENSSLKIKIHHNEKTNRLKSPTKEEPDFLVENGYPELVETNNSSNLSQQSSSQETICISDEELNYSSIFSKKAKQRKSFYSFSDAEDESHETSNDGDVDNVHLDLKAKYLNREAIVPEPESRNKSPRSKVSISNKTLAKTFLDDPFEDKLESERNAESSEQLTPKSNKNKATKLRANQNCSTDGTPHRSISQRRRSSIKDDGTPENDVILKLRDITPMPNYDAMNTPTICRELDKQGIKPLKRKRATQLLKYLYDITHPVVYCDRLAELSPDENDAANVKRKKISRTEHDDHYQNNLAGLEIVGDKLLQNENSDDLVFERKFSAKIPSCRIPLQIAWHNFLSDNPQIKENVLFYEPLQLEVLHSMLKEQSGCKFHVEDLLAFLDKKCITIRTAPSQGRRKHKV